MSKEPTGEGSKFTQRINIKMNKTHWCTYKGECKENLNISTLCWNCVWMQKFDIPALIEGEIKNGTNKRMEL